MKRTTVFLDEEIDLELRSSARSKGVPAASVLREALDQYFRKGRGAASPRLRFLAAGRSGTQTTSERQEKLLFQDLEPHGPAPRSRKKQNRKR